MPDVLQHGDTWINNIMFEKNPDGTLGDKVAAFIDWQICKKNILFTFLKFLPNPTVHVFFNYSFQSTVATYVTVAPYNLLYRMFSLFVYCRSSWFWCQ